VNFLSLDLEMNQPSEKIIQIGWAIGNLKKGVLTSNSCFVKIDEPLADFIQILTGIKESDLLFAPSLREAYEQLKKDKIKYDCFCNPIAWGGGDSSLLRSQLKLEGARFLFGRRWIDVKTIYQSYRIANGKKLQAGLSKAMTIYGLSFKGKKHNAEDDAKNTMLFYFELLKLLKT